jgi:hypothetical protein
MSVRARRSFIETRTGQTEDNRIARCVWPFLERAIEYLAMDDTDVSTLGLINPPAKDKAFESYLEDEYSLAFYLCIE